MSYSSDVGCVLKINMNCDACKMKMQEVLTSITGDYSVTIDADEGLVKLSGEMDPNILMKAINRNGKHAELKWLRLSTPNPYKGYPYNNNYDRYETFGYGQHGYGAIDQGPYGYRGFPALTEGIFHDRPQNYYLDRRANWDYHDYNNNSNYGYGGPYSYYDRNRYC